MAHAAGISCEGEIGFVGYASGEGSLGTDPAEAAQFARETNVDAMAISVGNVHLQQDKEGGLDLDRIRAIEAAPQCLWSSDRACHWHNAAPYYRITDLEFNINELRMAFGRALRDRQCRPATSRITV
jgi:fructose-bisphosphate aldolase class II